MARPNKPTALKVVQGTARPDRTNINEPKPKVEAPKIPSHLSPKAKTAFKGLCEQLGDMGVIAQADGKALELLCDAYSEWRDLRKVVDREGHTYQTVGTSGDVIIKARPEVGMASDAWKRISAMLGQFGLTPSSRAKVNATDKAPDADPLQDFLNRKKK